MPGAIVFAHANGFPAGTYRRLFEHWRDAGFDVHAIDKLGHDARFPVTDNWPHLRDELIDFIEGRVDGPAYLVGHSLGGFVGVLVASERPDRVRGLVLLDSPVLAGWKARALQLAKALRVGERYSPAHVSKRRRQHWPSAEEAYRHFAAKPAFARWAPGVLRDYIASGIEADGDADPAAAAPPGHRLAFRRDVETAIYNALPHHVPALLRRRPLTSPVAFVAGTESREVRLVGLAATQRLARGRVSWIDGSHLFPFERPDETAAEVLRWIGVIAGES